MLDLLFIMTTSQIIVIIGQMVIIQIKNLVVIYIFFSKFVINILTIAKVLVQHGQLPGKHLEAEEERLAVSEEDPTIPKRGRKKG